jgi:hypothetical protein
MIFFMIMSRLRQCKNGGLHKENRRINQQWFDWFASGLKVGQIR